MIMVSKTWCFTLNNYSDDDEKIFQMMETNYIIYGREVASTGTKHLQGYAIFPKAYRLSGVRKLHPKAHWEPSKKNALANRRYCSKEGDYYEKKKPRQGSKAYELYRQHSTRPDNISPFDLSTLVATLPHIDFSQLIHKTE